LREQVFQSLATLKFNPVHCIDRFQHLLKLFDKLKFVKLSAEIPFSANVEMYKFSEISVP
jgi:hypothetical protein